MLHATDKHTFNSEKKHIFDGDPIHTKHQTEAGDVESTNYFWTADTYEDAFARAGFLDFQWRRIVVNHAQTKEAAKTWEDWVSYCPIICFSADKILLTD